MRAPRTDRTADLGEPGSGGERRRWVSRISREQERRLYFLATVVLAAWYLVTRLL